MDDRVLFERKTPPDLAASIKDGRLFTPAKRLMADHHRFALILERTSADV